MKIAANVLLIPSTRARPCTGDLIPVLATTTTDGDNINANEDEEQPSPLKRHRTHAPASVGDGSSTTRTSYWLFSPEAFHLFRPSSRSGGDTLLVGGDSRSITETPQEALERRILVIQSVNKREDSWRNVIIEETSITTSVQKLKYLRFDSERPFYVKHTNWRLHT